MNANHADEKFFEEFIRLEFEQSGRRISAEGIGSRIVEDPGEWRLSPDGLREFDLGRPITLTRGLKESTLLKLSHFHREPLRKSRV